MMPKTLKFIFHHPLKQWPTGKKKMKMAPQKFEYLENQNRLVNVMKSIFHDYLMGNIW